MTNTSFYRRTIVMNSFRDLVDQLKVEYRESLAWNAVEAGGEWNWNTTFKKISDVHWVLTVRNRPAHLSHARRC